MPQKVEFELQVLRHSKPSDGREPLEKTDSGVGFSGNQGKDPRDVPNVVSGNVPGSSGDAVNEVLDVFTADSEFPPLPLPHDLNGWTVARWQVKQMLERVEAELGTVEVSKPSRDQ